MKHTTPISLAIAGVLLAINSFAQAPSKTTSKTTTKPTSGTTAKVSAPVKVTSVEGITEYALSNGMKVLLFPDQSKQTITVNITYLVGSRNENYGETGMAHLLEHLVFKGSTKHPNVAQELTAHGCNPNGTTWLDRTNYFEVFQATDENLNWALDMESDRMVNSFIAKKDLESEMTVVRNEFEMGENYPSNILMQRTVSSAYLWHNYGNSTIGARADIEKVPIDRLKAFYRNYYQPDNAILLVAGKFDEAKTLKLVNEKFGVIPKPTRKLQTTYTDEPTQDGERLVSLQRTGDVQALCAVYHIPAGAHADFPACEVMTELLTDEPSGKLYKSLVETKKASYVYGYNFALREPGVAVYNAGIRLESSLDSAKNIFVKTLNDFAKYTPSQEEVDRIKNKMSKNAELTLNSPEDFGINLSEYIAQGDWRLFFYTRDQIQKVTPEDVHRVAQNYLKPSNRTLGEFIPTKNPDRAEIPVAPDIASLLKDYKGGEAIAQGEVFDPSPSNIESRTKRETVGGVKMALLSKKTRGNSVNAQLVLKFGDINSLQNKGIVGSQVVSMLMRGTEKHTRQQIQDELDKLKARVYVYGGADKCVVNIETLRENLPAVLKLVSEFIQTPNFPVEEWEKLKQEKLAQIEEQKSDPQSIAYTELNRYINPFPKSDPRYNFTFDEQIAELNALTIDQIKQFHKDFYGASNANLAISGDFDEKEIKDLVTQSLANWKSPKPYSRLTRTYQDIAAINKSFETPDKANAMFFAQVKLPINDNDPDYPALLLGNEILGGGFLNSRLATRIRQKDGISYGVGSYAFADQSEDKIGGWGAYAIYAPENAGKLEVAFQEEIKKVLTEGFTKQEIEEAKKGWLQNNQVSRAQDGYIAGKLEDNLTYNRTFKWDEEFENKVKALTPEQINAIMKKYIDPSKISIVKAGDFEKAKKKMGMPQEEKPAQAAGNKKP
ncbi:pitrilysin family protein [Xanthocytophaga agilis]|uniref:Pitrilysin family protein n=1 Tax=Xanthocytophaga agilis TaxID=3048010 RepID=A0AAE3R5R9_9BACT|nr:pitrilysin family protein [Xanthocytophaga agilis]MDJ1501910.1 pitrilysin family protein [Xanthocytophaga agilis]